MKILDWHLYGKATGVFLFVFGVACFYYARNMWLSLTAGEKISGITVGIIIASLGCGCVWLCSLKENS